MGGVIGVLLASLALDALLKFLPVELPPFHPAAVDFQVLLFTMMETLMTGRISLQSQTESLPSRK
jgi:hypothetical protein